MSALTRKGVNMKSLGLLHIILHGLGLISGISCIIGALFLETLVFIDIKVYGLFIGMESNYWILGTEIGITCYGIIYFLYIAISEIKHYSKEV